MMTASTETIANPVCFTCQGECVPEGIAAGYGVDPEGNNHCFDCCAEYTWEWMSKNNRITLYLTVSFDYPVCFGKGKVTDWPGRLSFPASVRRTRNGHNWGLTRYDAWFIDREGNPWWGFQIGDNTQLIHCRKLKKKDTRCDLVHAN